METVLGVAETDQRITVVEMSTKGGRFFVRKVVSTPIEEEVSHAEAPPQADAPPSNPFTPLKEFHHRRAALALPIKNGLMREVTVPFAKEEHIRRTIKFEAERLIPSGKIQDYIIDFHRLGEENGKSRVLIVGMQTSAVASRINLMREVGFDPVYVDVDVAAAYGALKAAGFNPQTEKREEKNSEEKKNSVSVLVALHSGQVMLWLHSNGELRRVRSFILRSGTIEQKAEKFERELRRTLIAAGITATPHTLYLAGDPTGEFRLSLKKRLYIDVQPISISEAFGELLDENGKEELERCGLVACGAAIKLLGYDPLAIDLRQDGLAYRKPFDTIKTSLSCTLTLLFFLFFLIAYTHQFKYARDKSQLDYIRKKAAEYLDVLLPDPQGRRSSDRPVELAYRDFVERLRERQSGEHGKPSAVSALDVLFEVGKARAKVGGNFLLRSCSIQPRKITFEVEVDKVETGDALRNYIDRNSKMLITETASYRLERKRSIKGGEETEKVVFSYTFRVRTGYER